MATTLTRWALIACSLGILLLEIPNLRADLDEIAYEVSWAAQEEVLFLTTAGGSTRRALQYRLFGDGRLVREIFDQNDRQKIYYSDETMIEPIEISEIFEKVVSSHLIDLTPKRFEEATQGKRALVTDGRSVILHCKFQSFVRDGEALPSPFEMRVVMENPSWVARKVPEMAEARALVVIEQQLDGYFPESSRQVFYRNNRASLPHADP